VNEKPNIAVSCKVNIKALNRRIAQTPHTPYPDMVGTLTQNSLSGNSSTLNFAISNLEKPISTVMDTPGWFYVWMFHISSLSTNASAREFIYIPCDDNYQSRNFYRTKRQFQTGSLGAKPLGIRRCGLRKVSVRQRLVVYTYKF